LLTRARPWSRARAGSTACWYDPNALATATRDDLLRAADIVRAGLAGTIRSFEMQDRTGQRIRLEQLRVDGQGAGYVTEPSEVVNYVENHDNQTLFDNNAFKLPRGTSREDRARVQLLGAAVVAFSQGVAYFHAGVDTLRSKSLDRNSYDSGDWFNRLDWTYGDNFFGTGLPPAAENGANWARCSRCSPTRPSSRRRPTSPGRATPSATCCACAPARRCCACRTPPRSAPA
jgi:pullulanase